MSNYLNLRISEKAGGYEGTVTIAGLRPTKLSKSDGQTTYANRGAIVQAAQSLGRKLNLTVNTVQTDVKAAAKKSTKTCCK